MQNSIMIIGGYGAVGSIIAAHLAPEFGERMIIAGRSADRAAQFAQSLGANVRSRAVDVSSAHAADESLTDVGCVVMCLDLADTQFVQACFQRGIHYVDVSADYAVLARIMALDALARQCGASAILSVGLSPGLSNLMAKSLLTDGEQAERVDNTLMLGLGEKHGAAATMWTLDHLTEGTGSLKLDLSAPYGQRTAYHFAFSDQHTLPQTLPVTTAASWLCFDSALVTRMIGLARLPLIRDLISSARVKQFSLGVLQRWQVGSEDFVLTSRVTSKSGVRQAWLKGQREAEVTGMVTAEVVRRLVSEPLRAGVHHIDQVFELEDFLPLLKAEGVTYSRST